MIYLAAVLLGVLAAIGLLTLCAISHVIKFGNDVFEEAYSL